MSEIIPTEAPPAADASIATARRRAEIGGGGLRKRVARGTIVNTVYLITVNSLTIIQGLLLAHLLGTREYGLWGLLAISFGTLFALAAIGLDDKYIQQDHPDQRAAFEIAFTLQAMLCGLFTVIALIAIPLFTLLYNAPQMLLPGMLLAVAMPLIALQTPMWVFYRRMDFVKQRLLQGCTPVVTFVVTVPLAAAGVGIWSVIIGTVVGAVVAAILAVKLSPYKLRFRYEHGAIREYASFSWPLFVSSGTGVLMFQIPITIAARSIGSSAVGAITLASQITQYTRRIDDIVSHALYPAICAVKDQRDLLFESFSKSNRMALLWGFPAGVAVALFAPAAVPLVLGHQWAFAAPLIQILGATAALDQIAFNWSAFARARGETRVLALGSLVTFMAATSVGVPLLLSHGLAGFGFAILAGTVASLGVRLVYLSTLFPALNILGHVVRSFIPTLPGASAILLERELLGASGSASRLVGEVVVFALLVAITTWLQEHRLLTEAVGYLRQRARAREAQTEPATRLA